jgi:lipopolysaccharide transport system permease protein
MVKSAVLVTDQEWNTSMNPQAEHSSNLVAIFRSFKRNRRLIFEMTKRDIKKRYQGSIFGIAWSFITPLLMLAVYTFVFSVIFKSRWGISQNESRIDFAIILFAGLIIFNIFSESLNQSPSLIINNVNYVKKVIFPLEILSLVSIGSILFHGLVSLIILLLVQLLFKGFFPIAIFFLPFAFLPIILLSLGVSWFFSALGVYIRDISQILGVFTTILMFTSAIFFPLSALPEKYQILLKFNPIAMVVEECRRILVYGQSPDWLLTGILLIVSALTAYLGFWWFQKTRKGFADVL